jgi:hypothetical protein
MTQFLPYSPSSSGEVLSFWWDPHHIWSCMFTPAPSCSYVSSQSLPPTTKSSLRYLYFLHRPTGNPPSPWPATPYCLIVHPQSVATGNQPRLSWVIYLCSCLSREQPWTRIQMETRRRAGQGPRALYDCISFSSMVRALKFMPTSPFQNSSDTGC